MKIERGTLDIPNDSTPWVLVKPNDNTDWCVLWLQGWTSSADSHVESSERLAEANDMPFFIIDYAGHGKHPVSIEESTKEMQLKEVLAAYDKLVELGYEKIIVIGGSFGGYMATLLASERKVAGVILRAPALYPDHEFTLPYKETQRYQDEGVYKKFKETLASTEWRKAPTSLSKFDGQTFILVCELDSIVPATIPQAYFKAAKHGSYILIPKTDHSPKFMAKPEPYYEYIEHWISAALTALKLEEKLPT